MNALATAIQSEGLTGTAAEIVASFGETVALPHVHDRWSYDGVVITHGAQVAERLGQAIAGAGLTTAAVVYATKGFDLSLQETQDNLSTLAAAVPSLAGVCNALKAIGRPTQTRWAKCGLNALPSEADVTAALGQIADREWGLAVIALVNTGLENGDGKAAIKSQIAGT